MEATTRSATAATATRAGTTEFSYAPGASISFRLRQELQFNLRRRYEVPKRFRLGTFRRVSPPEPKPSRVNLRKQMDEIVRLRREMSGKPPEKRQTTTRAVARIIEDVHLEGRMGKFVVESDEPLARGGTEKGPSPLQYLMMGTAF